MNKQILRNTARFILCSIILLIVGVVTPDETITTKEVVTFTPVYSLNTSAGVHKVLTKDIVPETNTLEPNFSQNEFVPTTMGMTEDKKDVPELEFKVKQSPYKYYTVVVNDYRTTLRYDLQEYTYDLCVEYGITEYFTLILCQLYKESTYRENLISGTNDYGIAQINACNHDRLSKELGITDFLDPKQSILCNIYLMSDYIEKYGVERALICYNGGSPNSKNERAHEYARNIIKLWNNNIVETEKEEEVKENGSCLQ